MEAAGQLSSILSTSIITSLGASPEWMHVTFLQQHTVHALIDPSTMIPNRTYSASTATPLLSRPQGAKSLPPAFRGFLRNSACNPDAVVIGRKFDAQKAAWNTANTSLAKNLKGRHLQMIAIGGSIGNTSMLFTLAVAYLCKVPVCL
jgi:hypothetical protein